MQHHSQDPEYSASPQPEIRFWRMQHNIAPAPMMCSRLWRCIIEQGNTIRDSDNFEPSPQKIKDIYNEYLECMDLEKRNKYAYTNWFT
ncbi:hypothetical protein BpHYR1_035409 [Brachionus plicatilis]|uniref:Uncharacterized protein n=1 Tax=Brachionus plicatilis TaxID=10195 RepID=A0A3M7RQ86_BRAPC|nr:hypothetical protein BpHYR1_035409 [Brachionus plicatilis]